VSYVHGTERAYARERCRCATCREYQRTRVARNRAERAAAPASHGTRSTYDAGCRCDECKAARAEAYERLEREPLTSPPALPMGGA
jgi:hypothetical protein